MQIVVTGSSGKAGRAAVEEPLSHSYKVTGIDRTPTPENLGAPSLRADLTNLGQVLEVLRGADAVVHLANIPALDLYLLGRTFSKNITVNY